MAMTLTLIISFELYQAINQDNFDTIFTLQFLGLTASCIYFLSQVFQMPNPKSVNSNNN